LFFPQINSIGKTCNYH